MALFKLHDGAQRHADQLLAEPKGRQTALGDQAANLALRTAPTIRNVAHG
jgi:hypothetical protein